MHYKYGHTPFNLLQAMDTNVVLTTRFYALPFTICSYCLYGRSNRSTRKNKTVISINEYKPVTSVSDCVSVNVLVFITPGLIFKMSGFITIKRCQYACMFVDHHYGFTYIHILKSQTGDESVEAKEAFEAYAESHGVDIKNYHAKNRIFRSARWIKHCK